MKTDAEIRAKWKEVLDRPRRNPHVIDTGAFVIEVVRWAEGGLTPLALDSRCRCDLQDSPTAPADWHGKDCPLYRASQ